mgnify:CR=1 FL=1
MEFKKYPMFTENSITFLSNLIDKKCNINIDNILTKKIIKIWYDNNSKIYKLKIENKKNLKKIKKNENLLNKLIEHFSKKYPDTDTYNRRFYQKEQIILDNKTPEKYNILNNKKKIKYNDINYKLNNDRNYRLFVIYN